MRATSEGGSSCAGARTRSLSVCATNVCPSTVTCPAAASMSPIRRVVRKRSALGMQLKRATPALAGGAISTTTSSSQTALCVRAANSGTALASELCCRWLLRLSRDCDCADSRKPMASASCLQAFCAKRCTSSACCSESGWLRRRT